MSEPEQAKARRVRDVVVDAYIGVWCSSARKRDDESMDEYVKRLVSLADSIQFFLQNHRSHTDVWLPVKKVKQDQCSLCKKEWETFTGDGVTYCAWCGAEVEAEDVQA